MKLYKILFVIVVLFGSVSCTKDYLELDPTDKVSIDALLSSRAGIESFMANLYHNAPIEDFNCVATEGFNWNRPWPNNAGFYPFIMTDEAVGSQHQVVVGWEGRDFSWFDGGYKFNKDVNFFLEAIPGLDLDEKTKQTLTGEGLFLRAYTYFALAKRYGGVPIITKEQDINDGVETLFVPRSTEKETWEFVMKTCDEAAALLDDGDGSAKRATKWAALALKSRAALHAASVAKYWNRAPLSGEAVDKKLVGMQPEDAAYFYSECIKASEEIIKNGPYSLYQPSPSTPEEAAENYRSMFENPNRALNEVIFMKGFALPGDYMGSNQDNWGQPNQTRGSWPHPGRFDPTLELADLYENYSNPGVSAPIVTTEDGNVDNYDGYNPSRKYLQFDDPLELFADKDARLRATVILPMSEWKDTKIIIQGGLIKPNGRTSILGKNEAVTVDGKTYYSYGAPANGFYSGFDGYNMTRSGFGFKKFLNSEFVPSQLMNQSTTDWIDFRLAEVLLNYAEAVVESGKGDPSLAEKAINDIRHRAAHKTNIPLTLENVLRERRVELVFEHQRYWDLMRRREYHTEFSSRIRKALVPIFDTRTLKYIFVRQNVPWAVPNTFYVKYYYKVIPGISTNELVQNPQY